MSFEKTGEERRSVEDMVNKFLSSLEGLNYYVISREGFPIYYSRGMDLSKAEAATALSVDLITVANSTIRDATGKKVGEIQAAFEKGDEVFSVIAVHGILISIYANRSIIREVSRAISRFARGENVYCPHCKALLSLEVWICKRCGRSHPFTAEACPHCGYRSFVRKCPKCGGMVSNDGKRLRVTVSRRARSLAFIEGGISMLITSVMAFIAFANPWLSGLLGVVAGSLAGYLVYRSFPFDVEKID